MTPRRLWLVLVALVAISALLLALTAPPAGYGTPPTGYGVTLIVEGEPFEIDGQLLCRDLPGSVILSFGGEFHALDVCELLEKRVVRVSFDEGVRNWRRTLEELGIREGMSAEEVRKALQERGFGGVTMPSVSVTFRLVGDGVHYIANYVFTSLDYYAARGHGYYDAYARMLEDPLAVVRGYPPILIRLEDLARRLVRVKLTIVFTWNIGTYSYGGREYWRAEPIPVVTPYYREVGWQQNWPKCRYDANGNLLGDCPSYARNLNDTGLPGNGDHPAQLLPPQGHEAPGHTRL